MKINTQSQHSALKKNIVIHFPEGLPGFESHKNYRLYNSKKEGNLFWLCSTDDETIEFAVTIPDTFHINYEITIRDNEMALINANDHRNIIILVILSKKIQDDYNLNNLHANFLGPLIIDVVQKKGFQKQLNRISSNVIIKAS